MICFGEKDLQNGQMLEKQNLYSKGIIKPKVPADLGYYDLRLPEVREEQVNLAKYAGIEGFCYWHYWFGSGKELLE